MRQNEREPLSPSPSRLTDMILPEGESLPAGRIAPAAWMKLGILTVLVVGLFWTELRNVANFCQADANWSHGFIIPLFSLFLLFNWRRPLLHAERRICYWGWLLILLALLIRSAAYVQLHNDWIAELTLPLLIFGLVLYLCGPRVARIAFVPIFYLVLAIPLPDRIYQMISLPLQNFAAAVSTSLMRLFGAKIEVTASFMEVTSLSGRVHPLQVAEACSGIRSLMAFVALGVAMAYIQERPFWQRLIIMLAGIPIALAVNVLRVAVTSTMFLIDKPELGQKFMHTAMGMVLLIPALLLLFLLTQLLDRMYEDVEDEDDSAENSTSVGEGKA